MARLSPRRLIQKPFLLITSILALGGWSIAFTGACMLKVLHGAWWVIVYQFCIVIGHMLIFMAGSMDHYRIAMMAVLASSIPLLTIQVDYVIQLTKAMVSKTPSANAYVSGYMILLVVHYAWIIVIGSDKTTWLGALGQAEDIRNDCRIEPEFFAEKTIQQEPYEFTERVRALHTYNASIQDPNELSFEKGELLEIVDRKGNWWQARKSNGTIGIIPSNYFAHF
ncbi:uncharacterized protein B0P05DRAFT_551197 [Gilbertella persicaria]|uniref:uncharacterized protein n=1 Tax=Gilbertella persicaria TaxID=101096 RepID=UPI00221FB208|nr:uncharacterized protein B0P05DRAFT_551197 [Gilbertella persicaria]KAI8069860.1 hypothetical protein B0P05DRAFT_551197 [Gilbertella persicaria]